MQITPTGDYVSQTLQTRLMARLNNVDLQPLQLLARELTFVDPLSGERHCFQSQMEVNIPEL